MPHFVLSHRSLCFTCFLESFFVILLYFFMSQYATRIFQISWCSPSFCILFVTLCRTRASYTTLFTVRTLHVRLYRASARTLYVRFYRTASRAHSLCQILPNACIIYVTVRTLHVRFSRVSACIFYVRLYRRACCLTSHILSFSQ